MSRVSNVPIDVDKSDGGATLLCSSGYVHCSYVPVGPATGGTNLELLWGAQLETRVPNGATWQSCIMELCKPATCPRENTQGHFYINLP